LRDRSFANQGTNDRPSSSTDSQVFRGRLAAIFGFLVAQLRTLVEAAKTGSFNGRDVHKDVLAALVRLNKPIAFGRVKPLHSTCSHVRTPWFCPQEDNPRADSQYTARKTRQREPAAFDLVGGGLTAKLRGLLGGNVRTLGKLTHRKPVAKGNDKRPLIDGIPALADYRRRHPVDAGFRRTYVAPKSR